MPCKSTIPASAVQIGMFIADIDRPWLETPFLMQGFLVENDAQRAELARLCREVVVDHARSLGQHFSHDAGRDIRPDLLRAPSPSSSPASASPRPSGSFVTLCQAVRRPSGTQPSGPPPQIIPEEGHSRFEEELLYTAPVVDDIVRTLSTIRESPLPLAESLTHLPERVHEMASAVERNPDALIWLTKLKSADEYSYDHALDVSVHLMVFGSFLGLSTADNEQLGLAGLMQDIGKIAIPPGILNKPGKLDEAEYELVKAHVASSLELLVGNPAFSTRVLQIVAGHHERFDGSGYPRSLSGQQISLLSEAAGLVDTYCAMTRDRIYDVAMSSQKALESLIRMRDSKFRAPLVDQFVQCLGIYPVGSLVELNTGEVAVVIQQNRIRRLKPRLLIVLAPDKSMERNPSTLDLINDPNTPLGQPYRIVSSLPSTAYGINPAELYLD